MVGAVHDFRGTYNVTDYRWFNLRDGNTEDPQPFQHFGLFTSDYRAEARLRRVRRAGAAPAPRRAACAHHAPPAAEAEAGAEAPPGPRCPPAALRRRPRARNRGRARPHPGPAGAVPARPPRRAPVAGRPPSVQPDRLPPAPARARAGSPCAPRCACATGGWCACPGACASAARRLAKKPVVALGAQHPGHGLVQPGRHALLAHRRQHGAIGGGLVGRRGRQVQQVRARRAAPGPPSAAAAPAPSPRDRSGRWSGPRPRSRACGAAGRS